MMENSLVIGAVSASVVLSILLRMFYGTFDVAVKVKPWIASLLGILLGVLSMYLTEDVVTGKVLSVYLVQGFMVGATAIGLYEITKRKA